MTRSGAAIRAYVGDGKNRWPGVHRHDAARLYRLALERAAKHAVYHGVAEEGVAFREFAQVIGRHLNVPAVSISEGDADAHFGWFARFAQIDAAASSAKTQRTLAWRPNGSGLIDDLDSAAYFPDVASVAR
jgi:nucleoside-diphosphate-sugar epimerase